MSAISTQVGLAAKAAVDALGLTPAGGSAITSVRRKTPSLPEGATTGLPAVVISVGEETETERLTAAHKMKSVRFAVTIVTNTGQQLADNDTVRGWRDQIEQAVYDAQLTTFAGVTGFIDLRSFNGAVFDPGALAKDYNYSTLAFEAHVVETLNLTA